MAPESAPEGAPESSTTNALVIGANGTLALPIEAVTETVAILAKKGSGKTYCGCVLFEEMYGAGAHVVAIDPLGVWYGLRSGADGSPDGGLQVLILGGDHGDLPLSADSGAAVADLLVGERISAILDLSHFSQSQSAQFLAAFLSRLYAINREALHLFVDEADSVAPQTPSKGEQEMLDAMDTIVRRGRVRGLGCTLITQRPAVIAKNVLTQIEVLVAMRLTATLDRKAIDTWISAHGTDQERKAVLDSLATLGVGDAWVWSPNLVGDIQRIHVRLRRTYDASSTPKVGQTLAAPKALASMDLGALSERFAEQIEEAQAKDPKALRERVADLERQLREEKEKPGSSVSAKVVEKIVEKIVEKRVEVPLEVKVEVPVEVPVLRAGELERAEEVLGHLKTVIGEITAHANVQQEQVDGMRAQAKDLGATADRIAAALRLARSGDDSNHEGSGAVPAVPAAPAVPAGSQGNPPGQSSQPVPLGRAQAAALVRLSDHERRLLQALSRNRSFRLSRAQIGARVGIKWVEDANFTVAMNDLQRRGFLALAGSKPGQGDFYVITDEGMRALGLDPSREPEPQTTAEVLVNWRRALTNREYQVLEMIVGAHTKGISAATIARRLGVSADGGGFKAYFTTLRTNGLIVGDSKLLRASEAIMGTLDRVPGGAK